MFKSTKVQFSLPFTLVIILSTCNPPIWGQSIAMEAVQKNLIQASISHNQQDHQSSWDKIVDIFRRRRRDGSTQKVT